ncbi:MAG: ribosome maturation factor RimM [Pseudomonadota bacterium]|nr:ribosome maturation factor RimM [Pseudomonadota bacterium]
MTQNSFFTLGYIKHAHGIRGEVFVSFLINDENLLDLVFENGITLRKGTVQKHYAIEEMKPHKDGFILSLEGILDRNKAELLKGFEWIYPGDYFTSAPGENIYLHEILGFEVWDKNKRVGIIKSFGSSKFQDLLMVEDELGIKYDIPLVKNFIKDINFVEKKIVMDLPSGMTHEV